MHGAPCALSEMKTQKIHFHLNICTYYSYVAWADTHRPTAKQQESLSVWAGDGSWNSSLFGMCRSDILVQPMR